ncbi:MAG: thioredoxin domain-containing protein [Anaerolineae bacterium]
METEPKLQIITVSGACCMPHMARLDQALDNNLRQALESLGIQLEVQHVSLSAVLDSGAGLADKPREQILALFRRHGARCAPIVLITEKVRFAGQVPSAEQLEEALQTAVTPQV